MRFFLFHWRSCPDRRTELAQRTAAGMQPPPLPLVQEVAATLTFLLDSVDDACEDLIKLLLLCLVWFASRRLCQRWLPGWRRALPALLTVLAFPAADEWADATADETIWIQNGARRWFGLPEKAPEQDDEVAGAPLLVKAIDDYVEDGFKLVCLGAHGYMGWLVQESVQAGLGRWHRVFGRVAGLVVSVGTPASQYHACDCYGDALGDAAQRLLAHMMGFEATVHKKYQSCLDYATPPMHTTLL